ncbi:hypothetical protein QE368_000834 [Asaia bogorensis NBRC 16594]|nr:hypothetical protein [Asaia bogorensis NBRC 16594]
MDKTVYCSFCSKSQHEVRKIVAGPQSFICDGCVVMCLDIIEGGQIDAQVRRFATFFIRLRWLFRGPARGVKHG